MIIGRIFETFIPETPVSTGLKSGAPASSPPPSSSLLPNIQTNRPIRTAVQGLLGPLSQVGNACLEALYGQKFSMIDEFLNLAGRQEKEGNVEGAGISYELAIRIIGDELHRLEPWKQPSVGMDWTLHRHRLLTVKMIHLCWRYADFCETYREYEQADLGYEVFRRKMKTFRDLVRVSGDETVRSDYEEILRAQTDNYVAHVKSHRYEAASHIVPEDSTFLSPAENQWNPAVVREVLLDQAAKIYGRGEDQESKNALERVRRRFAALKAVKGTV